MGFQNPQLKSFQSHQKPNVSVRGTALVRVLMLPSFL